MLQTLGMSPTTDEAILVRMAAALKAESEAVLGGHAIETVVVTAPWITAWDGQVVSNSIINDVLTLVGIQPISWEDSHPSYLGETNSLLAMKKRQLCMDQWCGVDTGPHEQGKVAFLIRYVKYSGRFYSVMLTTSQIASQINHFIPRFNWQGASISTRGTTILVSSSRNMDLTSGKSQKITDTSGIHFADIF